MILKALTYINTRGIVAKAEDKFSTDEKFGKLLLEKKAAAIWTEEVKKESGKKTGKSREEKSKDGKSEEDEPEAES